ARPHRRRGAGPAAEAGERRPVPLRECRAGRLRRLMPDMAAKPQRSRAARPFDRSYYTVGSLLERQAKAIGRQPALVWEGGAWSYAEIDRRSRALATALRARGIGPGTSVLLMLDNHAEYILLW